MELLKEEEYDDDDGVKEEENEHHPIKLWNYTLKHKVTNKGNKGDLLTSISCPLFLRVALEGL